MVLKWVCRYNDYESKESDDSMYGTLSHSITINGYKYGTITESDRVTREVLFSFLFK